MAVTFDEEALRQIAAATAWWMINRPDAPDAISQELDEALARISLEPAIGEPFPRSRLRGIRRRFLRRIHHHIYYRVVGEGIQIIAFWHARRGSGPPI